jgi:RNA recognition motif-containing protein
LWFRACFRLYTTSSRFTNIEMLFAQDQHDPNRNRGFLFVEYYNHACADYARQKLSSPNFKVDGSQLTVSWAEAKGSTDASSAAAQVDIWAIQIQILFYCIVIFQFLGLLVLQ